MRCVSRDDDEFKEVLMTNVMGPFLVVKSFLPLIKKGKKKQVRAPPGMNTGTKPCHIIVSRV